MSYLKNLPLDIWLLLLEGWQNPSAQIFLFWKDISTIPWVFLCLTFFIILYLWCNRDYFIRLFFPTENGRKHNQIMLLKVTEVNNEVNANHKLTNKWRRFHLFYFIYSFYLFFLKKKKLQKKILFTIKIAVKC